MRLERLEIHGFKSFKNKTVLEFPDNFTVIVGPNGSGKSNIIDAVLFVMGKSRGLRANNLIDVIYAGNEKDKPADFARVSIHLKDESTGEVIKITREINRQGRSSYFINGKKSSKGKVLEIIGENDYNIILQDDVTKILDMKPKERRAIIDDLCGIREYDEKKEKALKELEKVEKRISDTQLILGEREGYLEQLKKERDEAIEYQNLKEELHKLKATILAREIEKIKSKLKTIDIKLKNLEEEREKKESMISELKLKSEQYESKIKELNSKLRELERTRASDAIFTLREEKRAILAKKENLEETLKILEKEIEAKEKRISELTRQRESLSEELLNLNSEINSAKEELNSIKKIKDSKLEKKIFSLSEKIHELKSKASIDKQRKSRLEADAEAINKEIIELENQISKLLETEKKIAREIDARLISNKSNFDKYQNLKEKLPILEEKREKLLRVLKRVEIELAEKVMELKTIEKASHKLCEATKAIMKLKEIIPGIHGIVANLGSVKDESLGKALEIAAGGGMEFIVVENEDVAIKCINYLKERKIGRATFLPLNKINVSLAKRCPDLALGFARDFIETKPKFRKVFEYIYRDTLLVRNLEDAKQLGIGKWRMVTLDGDLLEKSGAMIGGYIQDKTLVRFSNLETLEQEIKTLERKKIELDGEQQKLSFEIKKIKQRLEHLSSEVSGEKAEIEKLKLEKNSLREKRESLKLRKVELTTKLKEIKKEIVKLVKEIEKNEKKISTLEQDLEKLLKKRECFDEDKLLELEEKLKDKEILKGKLEERKKAIEREIKTEKEEKKSLEHRFSKIKTDLEEISNKLLSLEKEIRKNEEANELLLKEMEKLIEQRDSLEDEVSKITRLVGNLSYERDQLNEEINKLNINKASLETKLSDLELSFKAYENYEILEEKNISKLKSRVEEIEEKLAKFTNINLKAIENYERLKEEVENLKEKLRTLKEERESIFDFMNRVEKKKREVFMEAFEQIKKNFEEIYKKLTDGKGTLTLDNPRNISESGLIIHASPKGKKLLSLDAMSGGEKTLTCAAFLLAIQQYKASHFYMLDELDASLDAENSIKLAKMLREGKAQFIMITHNDEIIRYSDSVIGVSMSNGVSEIVGVRLNK